MDKPNRDQSMPAQETGVQTSGAKSAGDVLVSVIMVSYRTGSVVWSAIDAVLASSESIELIVVNNGNNESDTDRLNQVEADHNNVTLISGHGNIGFSRGCNLGASKAVGSYLMLLNPDCVLSEGAISQLVRTAELYPESSLFGANLVDVNFTRYPNSRREFATPWRMAVEILHLYRLAPHHPYFKRLNHPSGHNDGDEPIQVPAISGALMFMNTTVYKKLKGMDEDYFLHVEDMDFCLRHHLASGETYFLPDVFACHHQSSSQASWLSIEKHKAISFGLYFDKHFSGYYPKLFLLIVKGAVWGAFAMRVAKKCFTFPLKQVLSSKIFSSIETK